MVTARAGDILFYKSDGSFIENEISKITRSPYVHCAIAVGDGTLIEANGFIKTREISLSDEPEFDVFRLVGISDEQRNQIVDYAKSKIGSSYDYEKIVGLWVRFELMPHFHGFHEKGHYICSGLVDEALIKANVLRKNNAFVGDLAPGELLTYYKLQLVD